MPPSAASLPLCSGNRTRDFKYSFHSESRTRSVCSRHCLLDCEGYTYRMSIDSHMMEGRVECTDSPTVLHLTNSRYDHPVNRGYWAYSKSNYWYYKQYSRVMEADERTICEHKMKQDIAWLSISFPSQTVEVSMLVQSYTFVDVLSAIGGNMGLWIGFSFTSGIELLYWTYVLLKRQAIRHRQRKNK